MKSQRDLKIVFAPISGKVKATRFEVVGGCSTNLVDILKLGRRASSSFLAAWQAAPLKLTLAPPSVTTHYIREESRARSKQRDWRAAIIRPPPSVPPSPT